MSTKLHDKVPTVLDITCPGSNGKDTSATGGQVLLQWMAVGSLGAHPPFEGLVFNPNWVSTTPSSSGEPGEGCRFSHRQLDYATGCTGLHSTKSRQSVT